MNTEKRPVLSTTLYRKPMQPSNFDGILHKLCHWIFHTVFTRIFLLKGTLRRDQKVIFVKSPISSPIVMPPPPPPLDLSFWTFLTFLHYSREEVEAHLWWKFHKKIQRKSWSNVQPKLLACIGFLYKVVHKNGRLRKFDRAREIEFTFFTLRTISMKLGTLVHHVPGYKICLNFFNFCLCT